MQGMEIIDDLGEKLVFSCESPQLKLDGFLPGWGLGLPCGRIRFSRGGLSFRRLRALCRRLRGSRRLGRRSRAGRQYKREDDQQVEQGLKSIHLRSPKQLIQVSARLVNLCGYR
jgi:hypothetical protein